MEGNFAVDFFDKTPDRYAKMLMKLPLACDWVFFKGERVVAQYNYDATVKAGSPMLDISYCMTEACNQNIIKTVQWDSKKFVFIKQK